MISIHAKGRRGMWSPGMWKIKRKGEVNVKSKQKFGGNWGRAIFTTCKRIWKASLSPSLIVIDILGSNQIFHGVIIFLLMFTISGFCQVAVGSPGGRQ